MTWPRLKGNMPTHWFLTRHSNPYIYVPNLIGKRYHSYGQRKVSSIFLVQGHTAQRNVQ